MKVKNVDNREDFLLKKIRHYQGTIADFETFWNQKISQGESEISDETKSCKDRNADLNKAYAIIPVTKDEDKPEPISRKEVEKLEKESGEKKCKKCKKEKCECEDKKEKK